MESKKNLDRVIFYDGDCGFCNSAVQFVLSKKKKNFFFLPLQSTRAQEIMDGHDITINLDTMYYLENDHVYDRSSAALKIARGLKGAYPLLYAFFIIPKVLRDPFYNMVARNRHKIQSPHCMIPTPENEQYFLKD